MLQNHSQQNGAQGRLPEMAPLANPYVPFQMENPPKYEAKKGIVRGTLFPGLDLPFMGMVNKNPLPSTGMTELQAKGYQGLPATSKNWEDSKKFFPWILQKEDSLSNTLILNF